RGRRFDGPRDVSLAGDVADLGLGIGAIRAEGAGGGLGRLGVTVGDQNRGTSSGKALGDGRADRATTAREKGDPPIETKALESGQHGHSYLHPGTSTRWSRAVVWHIISDRDGPVYGLGVGFWVAGVRGGSGRRRPGYPHHPPPIT